MNFRYRVKGVAKNPFVLRGTFYPLNGKVQTSIFENELNYIKENCNIKELLDLQITPKAIPNNSKSKGVESNELPKSTSTENTSKVPRKV